jgi:hypothetical protein
VLSCCGLSVCGHGGYLFEQGESHGRVFDVGLEDLIDFQFPSCGRRGFDQRWEGVWLRFRFLRVCVVLTWLFTDDGRGCDGGCCLARS